MPFHLNVAGVIR